tara:strand:+ start:5345 stop:5701 length:357 start_codon:yes stop_codon:yes gene_type:complete
MTMIRKFLLVFTLLFVVESAEAQCPPLLDSKVWIHNPGFIGDDDPMAMLFAFWVDEVDGVREYFCLIERFGQPAGWAMAYEQCGHVDVYFSEGGYQHWTWTQAFIPYYQNSPGAGYWW